MAKKLKVLMLSHSSEIGGGAEMSMMNLFDFWAGKDLIEPHFVIRKPVKNMAAELKKRGWDFYPVYYTNWSQRSLSRRAEDVFRNARENAKAIIRIEKIIQKVQPDVVMTNTIVSPWAAIAAYFQRVPHVWFVREYGDADHRHLFEVGRDNMFADIGTLSDVVVTNSKTLAKHVSQFMDPALVKPLYTPFNLSALDAKIEAHAKNPFKIRDSLKLVITGRIAPSKGQYEAAKAVGELTRKGYSVELCVIGSASDAGDTDSLHSVIKDYGIAKKVHLVGHQSNPLAIVKYADVGIMASKREAFGRVTFEYMYAGLPVVGASSGATPEIVDDGKNGFIYRINDYKSLANKLQKYAADRELVTKHGEAAKQKTIKMMRGPNNADRLFEHVRTTVTDKSNLKDKKPLNYAHKWMEYTIVAQTYINESRVISVKRLLKARIRSKLKNIYLRVTGILGKNSDGL